MVKRIYAVMGATGHVGAVLADELLRRGHEVRAIGRDASKLEKLRATGAKPHHAEFDDAMALAEAFRGVDAVFSFIPPAYDRDDLAAYQDRVGEATASAIARMGVKCALVLSSLGAEHAAGTGPINGLHRHEQRLESLSGLDVLHLRPAFFMQNLFWSIPPIREHGMHPGALRADLPIPMVATGDIGLRAAELLDRLDFRGRSVVEFVGPRPITMTEATSALGRAIDKPALAYVQVSYEQAEEAMRATGLNPKNAALLCEMLRAMNEGQVELQEPESPDRKGKTTIEEFATQTFARVYRS